MATKREPSVWTTNARKQDHGPQWHFRIRTTLPCFCCFHDSKSSLWNPGCHVIVGLLTDRFHKSIHHYIQVKFSQKYIVVNYCCQIFHCKVYCKVYCRVHPALHWAEAPARPKAVPNHSDQHGHQQPDLWGSGWLQQPRSAGAVASCRPLFYGDLGNNPMVSSERNKIGQLPIFSKAPRHHLFNGNFRILKWRFCTRLCFVGIFPYIGLIYGRYLQFRFLKWPLTYLWVWHIIGYIPIPAGESLFEILACTFYLS